MIERGQILQNLGHYLGSGGGRVGRGHESILSSKEGEMG